MDIGSYGYLKGTNNKCTYKLTDHLMVNIETIIALASMAYIVDLDATSGDEQVFNIFIYECCGLHPIDMIGFH